MKKGGQQFFFSKKNKGSEELFELKKRDVLFFFDLDVVNPLFYQTGSPENGRKNVKLGISGIFVSSNVTPKLK